MFGYLRFAMLIALALGPVIQQALGADSLVKRSEIALAFDLGNKLVANWTGGALIVGEMANTAQPEFHVFDSDGQVASYVALRIPGAAQVTVAGYARGVDGRIVACGDSFDSEGRGAPYIAIFSSDGASLRVIRTSPYSVRRVVFASDGTIWAFGRERDSSKPSHLRPEAGVIRRFDSEGKEIGSFVLQSSTALQELVYTNNYLAASANSIAWYCVPAQRYVEISLDGKVLSDIHVNMTGPAEVTGFALTDAGTAFISTETEKPLRWNFERLDRDRSEWVKAGEGDGWIRLYGAHGNLLVVDGSRTRKNTIEFFEETH